MDSRISQLLGMLVAGAVAVCMPAAAQSTGVIDGYTLGFVFDSRTSGLRPLVGIPGAAMLGSQLDAGFPIRQAYVSPRQNYAVALGDKGAVLASFVSTIDPPAMAPLGFDAGAATVVALSPNGSAGAFYGATEAVIRIVTGLPGTPAIARSVPVSGISGIIRLLAISNDAAQLVAVADTDNAGSLIRIDADGGTLTLANPAHASALQFIADSHDLLIADDAADTVSVVQDVAGSAVLQPLASALDGIAGPIGLNVSLDGKQIIVANGRAGNILVLRANGVAGGPPLGPYSCPCNLSELGRLNGNSVFVLNDVSDSGPLWIFDGDSATPRVVFIPAVDAEPAGLDR
jgi:hypothetical protein